MKLVLMLPENKPPFMGMLFANDGDELVNQDLILNHRQKRFRIIIERFKDYINLRLICDQIVQVRFYNHVNYQPEQLQSWLYVVETNKPPYVIFAHLNERNDKFGVATTSPQNLKIAFKIVKCELFTVNSSSTAKEKVVITSLR